MKKSLSLLQSESGFYLPIVLVLAAFIFLFTTVFIYKYENHVYFTESMLNQIELETLVQMIMEDFTNMVREDKPSAVGSTVFEYPEAKVTVKFEQLDEIEWLLECTYDLSTGQNQLENMFSINVDPR